MHVDVAVGALLRAEPAADAPVFDDDLQRFPPPDRSEALRYWGALKPLAVGSDVALGPRVDKVNRYLPAYFEWIDSRADSPEEVGQRLVSTGADNYFRAVDEFWQAVLLVVIDRIDILSQVAFAGR